MRLHFAQSLGGKRMKVFVFKVFFSHPPAVLIGTHIASFSPVAISVEHPDLPFGHIARAPRVSLDEAVMFKPDRRQNLKGLVRDISASGAYLVTPEELLPGTEMILYLQLPIQGKKNLCIVSASIARTERHVSGPFRGYGVAFDEKLPLTSQEVLRNFITFKETGLISKSFPSKDRAAASPQKIQFSSQTFRTPVESTFSEIARQDRSLARLETHRKRKQRNRVILWTSIALSLLLALFSFLRFNENRSLAQAPSLQNVEQAQFF